MQALADGFLRWLPNVRVNSGVTKIDVRRRSITINGTTEIGYDRLITTLPLPELAKVTPALPRELREGVAGLPYRSVSCVTLGIDRPAVTAKHLIAYPEPVFVMTRVFAQSNVSPYVRPEGTSSLILEIPHDPDMPIAADALIERGVHDAIKARLLTRHDTVLVADLFTLDYGEMVAPLESRRPVAAALDWLRQYDIYAAGRFGAWEPLTLDGALLAGKHVAAAAAADLALAGAVAVPAVPAAASPVGGRVDLPAPDTGTAGVELPRQ
jgi:UDP-galactopyranose mutase